MANGTFRLDRIWEKKFVGNKLDTVCAFIALEVKKSLLTVKPHDFIKRPEDYNLLLLPENIKRKLDCYRCNIFFVNNFADALVQSKL